MLKKVNCLTFSLWFYYSFFIFIFIDFCVFCFGSYIRLKNKIFIFVFLYFYIFIFLYFIYLIYLILIFFFFFLFVCLAPFVNVTNYFTSLHFTHSLAHFRIFGTSESAIKSTNRNHTSIKGAGHLLIANFDGQRIS
jgi:hypothetical protein